MMGAGRPRQPATEPSGFAGGRTATARARPRLAGAKGAQVASAPHQHIGRTWGTGLTAAVAR